MRESVEAMQRTPRPSRSMSSQTLIRFHAASRRFFLVPAAPFRHNIITFSDEHLWIEVRQNGVRPDTLGLREAEAQTTEEGYTELLSQLSPQPILRP